MKLKLIFALALFLQGTFSAVKADTIIQEITLSDSATIWTKANGPYWIQGNVTVPIEYSLEIEEGTNIFFEGPYGIYVGGILEINGSQNLPVVLKGKEIGNGKHVLWKGVFMESQSARIHFNYGILNDAETGLNTSQIPLPFSPTTLDITFYNSTIENNIVGIKTGIRGASIMLTLSLIANNRVGISASLTGVDSNFSPGIINANYSTIENNHLAMKEVSGHFYSCVIQNNDTAIWDAAYVRIDSSSLLNNGIGFYGHSLSIQNTSVKQNSIGLRLRGRNENRTLSQTLCTISENSFETNGTAILIEEGNRFGLMECNLFIANNLCVHFPAEISNGLNQTFEIQRNVFISNPLTLKVVNQTKQFTPENGTSFKSISMHFNTWFGNGNILSNFSSNNLNLFRNYMIDSKANIETKIQDGSDSSVYGLINYTVSGDTARNGDTVTIKKIEDVIKHNDYDTIEVMGTSYSFIMCQEVPGNPNSVQRIDPSPKIIAYPNPTSGDIWLKWEFFKPALIHLYDATGKEYLLGEISSVSPASIPMKELAPGIYFLRVGDGVQWQTLKILKKENN
ncbi:MAG: T9SS type A sorting domain-containing protein [Bacteroidetes bacterium]|nr:T9SS type A sorting domain-containing protein [Bacteroidota bacterium]